MRFTWARWLRSSSRPQGSPSLRAKRHSARPLLELLEDRTAPAVLPAAAVSNQTTIGVDIGGVAPEPLVGYSPNVAMSPVNSNKLVEVHTNGTNLVASYSTDGGASWSPLINPPTITPLDTPNLVDPSVAPTNPPTRFTVLKNPTVAIDRAENVYIVAVQSNAAGTHGALVMQRLDFSGGAPAVVANDIVIQRWTGTDSINNPIVAVDNNLQSFTDPNLTSSVQTDAMATLVPDGFGANGQGVAKALYVAWNTANRAPNTNNTGLPFNPNVIMVAGSGDGGFQWTAPQLVNDSGHFEAAPLLGANPHYATPQIVFTQGSGDGRVRGGQLVFVWNDFANNAIQVDASTPSGIDPAQIAAASYQFTGTTGQITDGARRVNSAAVVTGGTGYSLGNILTVQDGVNGQPLPPAATNRATLQVSALAARLPVVISGGTGYTVNDVLTFVGGTGTATTVTVTAVTGGVITTVAITNPGSYTVLPANPNSVTGGTGTGAQIRVTFDVVSAVTVATPGAYIVSPTNPVTVLGGGGTGATFNLTMNGATADLPSVSTFTTTVNIPASANFTVRDLEVTINATAPNLSHMSFVLVQPSTGTTINLIRNRIDSLGANIAPQQGIAGANLGLLNTYQLGTVFADNAPRNIVDTSFTAPYIARFTPETGQLNNLVAGFAGNAARISGDWQLVVTDFRNDGQTTAAAIPNQLINSWSLNFSQISTNGFGFDDDAFRPILNTDPDTPVVGAVQAPYPRTISASGPQGVGPNISVAVDNTLGAFSPYQGRLYIAYTALGTGGNDPDVYLIQVDSLTPAGFNAAAPLRVNDDSLNDNFSQGSRPQFMPTVAVDQTTGTLGIMYYDGRMDPSRVRVATSFVTSIDGGDTFSPNVFLNTPHTAIDAITGKTVYLEPVPSNQPLATPAAAGFGDRQGLVMNAGKVIPVFSGNDNIAGSFIKSATVTIGAGPRIIYGDMGPIVKSFTTPVGGVTYNNVIASDGTRKFTGFVVQFDRPVDPSSLTGDDVVVSYRDTVTPLSAPANLVVTGNAAFTITALDTGTAWGPGLAGGNPMAETFLIELVNPLHGVGTYSYSVGPNINDRIRKPTSGGGGGASSINQYASSVVAFSSQFGTTGWSAAQATGAPDVFTYGDDQNAWSPLNQNGPPNPEFITLGYTTPVFATGVTVRESFGNGFVTQIDLLDVNNVFHTVWTGVDTSTAGSVVDFSVTFPTTTYLVKGVRVIVDPTHSASWEEIDSVQLQGNLTFSASGTEINLPVPPAGTGGTLGSVVWPTPPAGNADTTVSTIPVAGVTQAITDINVQVQLTHSFNSDLSLRLVAPNGVAVVLSLQQGGSGVDGYLNTTFDDQASTIITAAAAPWIVVRPENPLSAFNGMAAAVANGNWVLQVNDSAGGDSGTLLGWSITFNSNAGTTGAVADPGNVMDQNHDSITGGDPLDIFAIPTPINGTPFQLPYDQETLPLVIPGPHVIDTSVSSNPSAPDNLSLNTTNNSVDVTFDRNIQPASFTPANVVRIIGPVGPITMYTLGPAVTFTGGGGTGARGYATIVGGKITGVVVTSPGTGYTSAPNVIFNGGGGSGAVGAATVGAGSVTGVTIVTGGSGYTSTTPQTIPSGGTLDLPITINDSLQVNNLGVALDITHSRLADLTVNLIAPDGTVVPLFSAGTGANLTNTVFDDFAGSLITSGTAPYTGTFRSFPGAYVAKVLAGGTGYAVNDVLTIQGGSFLTPATLRVTTVSGTGAITGFTIVNAGIYTVAPSNPVSVSGGAGTGATFNVTFGGLSRLNGKNFLGTWVLRIVDNGTGATGTLNRFVLNPISITPNPPGGTPNRTFRITFPTQTVSGSYSVVVGSDSAGNYILDTLLNRVNLVTPGTGYQVDDILQINGGTGTPGLVRVTGINAGTGAITSLEMIQPGEYTVNPPTTTTVTDLTTPAASGAVISLVFGNRVDTNLNAGVDQLRGGTPVGGTLVSTTYPTGTINTPLPASQVVDSRLTITDSYLIQRATLQLSILHQNIPDLEARLIAPDGTTVLLFSRVGTTGSTPHANFTNTIFDDTATSPIQLAPTVAGVGIGTGPYTPQLPLGALRGKGSQGTWILRITSNSSTLNGTLVYWNLKLNQTVAGLGEAVADQFTAPFRIFTQDPTSEVAKESWTAVGPAAANSSGNSGRVGGLAVDPSDPSGNTVYASGASGGLWKTTNFLDPNNQPVWIPLTDLGAGFSLNTGSIAVFGRNNDPNQSIIFVLTGEGDTGTSGVGFLRSMDGGRTWNILDSRTNVDAQGNILPIGDAGRDRVFVGTTGYKVVVDPNPLPNGHVAVYAALGGGNGGIWRSTDSGGHWTRLQAGTGTDVVLSQTAYNSTGNLTMLYGAIMGQGVYWTPNALSAATMQIRGGGNGVPLRRNADNFPTLAGIPVLNAGVNPSGNFGRILLASPAPTGDTLKDALYSGWLYATVITVGGFMQGTYVTKDFGLNWTRIRIPVFDANPTGNPDLYPTNDDSILANYDVFGNSSFAQGMYDAVLAVDPNNPSVFYLGGLGGTGSNGQKWGVIRVDITKISDVYSTVAYDNSNNDGGRAQFATTGRITLPAGGTSNLTGLPLGPGEQYGIASAPGAYLNQLRDPNNPFLTNSTLFYTNVTNFTNTGENNSWMGFLNGLTGGDQHELLAIRDPLTGRTRIIYGNDHSIATGTDRGDGSPIDSIGTATSPSGSRTGNIQISQFYYGAAQPSTLAADLALSMFYGMAQDDGFPRSSAYVLDNGDLNWNGITGDGGGVATDQTGSGSVYQYRWPCCGNDGQEATDFFKFESPTTGYLSRTTGLVQPGDDPANNVGQWPFLGTVNFAVNPIDPTAIVISSTAGRVFLTSGPTLGTGKLWIPIAEPSDLDGTQSLAMAFGAPADAFAPLNDFIYVGTNGGRIYVTFSGGGALGGAAAWKNLSTGLSGGGVQAIVTNPNRGSREAFAVTGSRVFWMADSAAPGATWVDITGNLFSAALTRTLFNDPAQAFATLKSLKSIQADWRFAIPDDLTNPNGPKHPVLYVGGEGGVFRSLDKGVTWTYFPDVNVDGALQNGGLLPSADVRDLDLVLGNINPLNGKPDEQYGRNMLVATTYGRGTFAIRLSDTIQLANGDPLYLYRVDPVDGPHIASVTPILSGSNLTGLTIQFSGVVDPATFTSADILSLTDPFGNPIAFTAPQDTLGTNPHNIYTISFAPQSVLGFYSLVMGPNISDYSGNRMDQNQNSINGEETADIYSGRFLFQPGVNSAPVLTALIATVPSILEDDNPNGGVDLQSFLAANPGLITDGNDPAYAGSPGGIAPRGIAITSVDNTYGVWEYSTDSGVTWKDLGSLGLSNTTALALEVANNNFIRFLPNANYNSNITPLPTFTFRAWDLTGGLTVYGADDTIVDMTSNGGSTPYSATMTTAFLDVIPVNDVPSFTGGSNINLLEDAPAQSITGWATNILPYPGLPAAPATDEAGQVLDFIITTNNNALFSVLPAIDPLTGTLTFTLAPNANGSATVRVRLHDDGGTSNGGVDTSAQQTFTINVTAVNDAPILTASNPPAVNEDSGAHTIPNWATFSGGPPDEAGQTVVTYIVSNISNPSLFSVLPTVNNAGTLSYTLAANAFGTTTFDVQVRDNGGTANGGVDTSAPQTFTLVVNGVNDRPTFTANNPPAVNEDTGLHTITNWVTSFTAGPPNESSQTVLAYIVSNISNPSLFSVLPAVSTGGTLTYTLAPDAFGTTTFNVQVQDNGGTAFGGVDTSLPQTFTLTVNAVNDAPSFVASNPPTVNEDAGLQTILNWAVFTAGPPNESSQVVLAYTVTNISNPSLFSVLPAVSNGGTLTYTLAPNANGSTTFDVRVRDNGGTANGGVDTSITQTFTLNVNAVNDAPTFTASNPPAVNEDTGAHTITNWATFSPGPANESSQSVVAYTVSNISDPSVFSVLPSVSNSGTLTYTLAADAFGTVTFDVRVQDDGGTAFGGVDLSAIQTFTLVVNAVNDQPDYTASNPPTVNEDAGTITIPGWVTSFNPGPPNEASQAVLAYLITNVSNPSLFSVLPAVSTTGTLTYTLAADANGTSTFDVQVQDNGGTAFGGIDISLAQTFTINVNAVNDAPTFTASNPPAVNEDTGAHTITNWATFSPGPANESSQSVVAYTVSNISDPSVFSVLPSVSNSGTLTYTLAADAFGTVTFDVRVQDDGGTAFGGVDLSAIQTFTLVVNAVNDQPDYTASNPPTVNEDAGTVTIPGWVTAFYPGPPNEASQAVLAYLITNVSNPSLFSVLPAVSTTGTLTYTLAADANGTSTFDVQVQDNGGTSFGGIDISLAQTFTINVNAVNDAPSFTATNPATVLEDTGLHTVTNWATFIPGPANESSQSVVGYTVSNISNPSLFSVLPVVNNSGTLVYTLTPDAYGTTTFDVVVQDNGGTDFGGVDTSVVRTFTLTVTGVNDQPTFVATNPPTVNEDSGSNTVTGWVTAFIPGPANESSQVVSAYVVSNISNPSLFSVLPTVSNTGTLSYTLAANAYGSTTFEVRVRDNGGTSNGGVDTSAAQTFTLTVNNVNDAPSFTASNPSSRDNNGLQTVPNWATFNPGQPNESGQSALAYHVTVVNYSNSGNVYPFTTNGEPKIDPTTGTLTYTLVPNASGTVTFEVTVQDNGGTDFGGVDLSGTQTFLLTIQEINDQPSFTASNPPTVNEDAGLQTIPNWATFFSGSINEPQSVVQYLVSNISNPSLFSVLPAVSTSGTLSYTLAPNANGTTTFAVQVQDNGGTTNGGVDLSNPQTFSLTVNAVNDQPSFTASNVYTNEGVGLRIHDGWATFNPGPNEASQSLVGYTVQVLSGGSLFTVAPAVDNNGRLTYTLGNTRGVATIRVTAQDNGGTDLGGINSVSHEFTINVRTATTTTLTGPASSVYGDEVAFTAQVTPRVGGTSVLFGKLVAFRSGSTVLGYVALNSSGVAVFRSTTISGGVHNITATFVGDTTYANSTSPARSLTVAKASGSAYVFALNPIASYRQSVTFVGRFIPASGDVSAVAGDIMYFMNGDSIMGTATLPASGIVSFTTTSLPAGAHSIRVIYGGSENYIARGSAYVTQTVKINTATTVISSLPVSYTGEIVTFTAKVIPVAGSASALAGQPVYFMDGSTLIGVRNLNSNGEATMSTGSLTIGQHRIKVMYLATALHFQSTSDELLQTVLNGSRRV